MTELIHCTICGKPLKEHQRCQSCTILAGPGHLDTTVDARGWCQSCVTYWAKQATRGNTTRVARNQPSTGAEIMEEVRV